MRLLPSSANTFLSSESSDGALSPPICYPHAVPIFYECDRCTACCRWPGQVRLTDEEIARLATFKGMSEFDFIQQFTKLRSDRRALVLAEKANGECIFLGGDRCAIQPVKPQQCRAFPNLWNFPGFERTCRAIPRRVTNDEYRRLIEEVTGRVFPQPGGRTGV